MPEMVKVSGGPGSKTLTESPTWKWYLVAVPSSMATWFEAVGPCPETGWRAESWGFEPNVVPRVGAPPVVMALPCLSTNCA